MLYFVPATYSHDNWGVRSFDAAIRSVLRQAELSRRPWDYDNTCLVPVASVQSTPFDTGSDVVTGDVG